MGRRPTRLSRLSRPYQAVLGGLLRVTTARPRGRIVYDLRAIHESLSVVRLPGFELRFRHLLVAALPLSYKR